LPTRDDGHCGGQFRGQQSSLVAPSSHLPAFIVARPITSAEILAVKFRAAAWSALLTWVMIVFALLAVLPFSHATTFLIRWGQQLVETQGGNGWVLLALFILLLPWLTWKWMINQVWAGLTGRYWIAVPMACSLGSRSPD